MATSPRQTQEPLEPNKRLDHIDGLRAICALWVLLGHVFALGPLELAHLAVTVFLVLSGYCLALPHATRLATSSTDWRKFYVRRALRILPPYYAALALSVVIDLCTHATGNLAMFWRGIVGHVALVQNLHFDGYLWDTTSINPPMWSIAVEWQIYFLFPLILIALTRLRKPLALVGIIAIAVAASYRQPLDACCLWYVGVFAIGAAAPLVQVTRQIRRFAAWSAVGCTLAVAGIIATGGWTFYVGGAWLGFEPLIVASDLLGAIAAASFLVWRPDLGTRFLSTPLLVAIGAFSYSLYLIHYPLWITCRDHGVPGYAFTIVIIPLAFAFYLIFERPFMHKKPALWPARRPLPLEAVHPKQVCIAPKTAP